MKPKKRLALTVLACIKHILLTGDKREYLLSKTPKIADAEIDPANIVGAYCLRFGNATICVNKDGYVAVSNGAEETTFGDAAISDLIAKIKEWA